MLQLRHLSLSACLVFLLLQHYQDATAFIHLKINYRGFKRWHFTHLPQQRSHNNVELFIGSNSLLHSGSRLDATSSDKNEQQKPQKGNFFKDYKFGDVSKTLFKTAASAINEVTGKEQYEFGDLSRWLDKKAKAQVSNLTGRADYEFGDLTRWTASQIQHAVTNFTGKEEYQVGDISQEIIRRAASGEYKLQDLVLAIKVLLALGANFSPVGAALPIKILLELFNYSVAQELGEKVVGALAESLDQRLKQALTGDANYQLGDLSKRALMQAIAEYTGKENYEFGDIARTIVSQTREDGGTGSAQRQVASKKAIHFEKNETNAITT